MDLSLTPKLLAATLMGGAAVASLPPRAASAGFVGLKLEWIKTGKVKSSETVFLRALSGTTTIFRQAGRTIEAKPMPGADGTIRVELKIVDVDKAGGEALETEIRMGNGETVTVMGTVHKEAKETQERLFFLTANSD